MLKKNMQNPHTYNNIPTYQCKGTHCQGSYFPKIIERVFMQISIICLNVKFVVHNKRPAAMILLHIPIIEIFILNLTHDM